MPIIHISKILTISNLLDFECTQFKFYISAILKIINNYTLPNQNPFDLMTVYCALDNCQDMALLFWKKSRTPMATGIIAHRYLFNSSMLTLVRYLGVFAICSKRAHFELKPLAGPFRGW